VGSGVHAQRRADSVDDSAADHTAERSAAEEAGQNGRDRLGRVADAKIDLFVVVAPATLAVRIVFPMSSMLAADADEQVGPSAGLLLGSNKLGAICGTFIAPFFLMPILISPQAVVLLTAINALTGNSSWCGRHVPSL
jgi:hypothetical protein